MGKHQEESSTSQLGWPSEEPPILYRQTHKILLKNIKRYLQEGGLDQTPRQEAKEKEKQSS